MRSIKDWWKENPHKRKEYTDRYFKKNPLRACLYRKAMRMRKVNRTLGMECDVTIDGLIVIYNKQKGLCAISGRRLLLFANSTHRHAISVDRKKTEKGYRLKNIRFVTNQVNSARGTGTDAQLKAMCREILSFKK